MYFRCVTILLAPLYQSDIQLVHLTPPPDPCVLDTALPTPSRVRPAVTTIPAAELRGLPCLALLCRRGAMLCAALFRAVTVLIVTITAAIKAPNATTNKGSLWAIFIVLRAFQSSCSVKALFGPTSIR